MKPSRLSIAGILLLASLASSRIGAAAEKRIDFDGRKKAAALPKIAGSEADEAPHGVEQTAARNGDSCQIRFQGKPVTVDAKTPYAEVAYKIDEKCRPVLLWERYETALPKNQRAASSHSNARASLTISGRPEKETAAKGSHSCTIEVFETRPYSDDPMISMSNVTTWEEDGREILRGEVNGEAKWPRDWVLTLEPQVSARWVTEFTEIQTRAWASFKRSQAPEYPMMLIGFANIIIESCLAWPEWAGTLMPGSTIRQRTYY